MAAEAPDTPSLESLLAQAEAILGQLQALQAAFGEYLDRLADLDWTALAAADKLAGTPKFLIERTITDARNVLVTGQQDLADILRAAAAPDEEFVNRLTAMVRLYSDAPNDIRNRYLRLTTWVSRINESLQDRGEPPLLSPSAS